MKKYTEPKMEYKTFMKESVVTDSTGSAETWQQENNANNVSWNSLKTADVTVIF